MNRFRSLVLSGSFAAILTCALLGSPARADLAQWQTDVNAGSPAFVGTNITPIPTNINVGTVPGDITYEFITNAAHTGVASALAGSLDTGKSQALKFNQYNDTGQYGVTAFGVADYTFGVPTDFGKDVLLDFVSNSAAGTTSLYVNGAPVGTPIPVALALTGTINVGGMIRSSGATFDVLDGKILGLATFNRQLTAAEIQSHATAFGVTPNAIPEPGTLALLLGALPFGLALRRRK